MTKYACTVRNIAAMFTVRSLILQGLMQELSYQRIRYNPKSTERPVVSRGFQDLFRRALQKIKESSLELHFIACPKSKWCPWFSTSWVLAELLAAHSFWYFTIDCLLKIIYRHLKDMCLKYLASGFGHRCVFRKSGFASAATASWNPKPGLRIASVHVSCRQTRLLKASGSP